MLFTNDYPDKKKVSPADCRRDLEIHLKAKLHLTTCIYVLKAELAALKMKTLTETALGTRSIHSAANSVGKRMQQFPNYE